MTPPTAPATTLAWDELFPPASLVLRAGHGVELRYLTDELLPAVASVAAQGIHDPSWQPMTEWTDVGDRERARSVVSHVWRTRADVGPEHWVLSFAVLRDGVVVGRQDLEAGRFATTREVSTGSWLGQVHQGRGTGSVMRRAVLSLGFDHLGALSATTSAWKDNGPSNAVSRRTGYEPDGEGVAVVRGERREEWRYRMTAARWRGLGHPRVEVEGLTDACREVLGAGVQPPDARSGV